MKIASAQIDNYIQRIAAEKISGCLIFGPEEPSINYRFDIIAKKISPDLSDPFLVVNISKERLAQDKSLLNDEFYSFSMLGGRKLILIRDCDINVINAVKALFEDSDFAKKGENFILIQAGDLDKSSALRKACEDNPNFAAIACYEDDDRIIKSFISAELLKHQIKSDSQLIDFLFEKFGKNRQTIISELEKIAIFLGDKKDLTIEIASKLTALEAEITTNDFIMNFAAQKFDISMLQLEKLFKDGFEAITLIRFLSNYLQKLYYAKIEIELKNLDFESAVKSQRLFFKTEMEFRKHLKNISLSFLTKTLHLLENLELKIKTSNIPSKLLFIAFMQDSLVSKTN